MAAGQTLYSAGAMAAISPTSAGATLDTRNQRPVLDFIEAADSGVFFQGVLPAHYNGGDLAIAIHWSAETAEAADSDECKWTASFERLTLDSSDTAADDFQAEVSVEETLAVGPGIITETVITLLDASGHMDGAIAGDSFRLFIQREGIHANDTMDDDAELLDIRITEA